MAVTINGSAGVTTNSGAVYNGLQTGTAVTASGTSVDFTSIPSWVRRITVMFRQVSTSGTSPVWLQIGTSGGIETSSYDNGVSNLTGSVTTAQSTGNAAFILDASNVATSSNSGSITLSLISSNTWASVGILLNQNTGTVKASAGSKALSGVLDRIRITTANGTDTFDAGTINIIYE